MTSDERHNLRQKLMEIRRELYGDARDGFIQLDFYMSSYKVGWLLCKCRELLCYVEDLEKERLEMIEELFLERG